MGGTKSTAMRQTTGGNRFQHRPDDELSNFNSKFNRRI